MSNLFNGKANPFGGLSNENQLAKECPREFREYWTTNKWCELASAIFFGGINTSNWKYKSSDEDTKKLQHMYLHSLLSGWGLKHEDKTAIVGWMLSEMLVEIPNPILKPKGR